MKKPGKRHRTLKALKKAMNDPDTRPKLEQFLKSVPSKPGEIDLDEAPASAELTRRRTEVRILTNIFHILSNATIKSAQAKDAVEVLDYLEAKVAAAEQAVQDQLKLEEQAASSPAHPAPAPSAPNPNTGVSA